MSGYLQSQRISRAVVVNFVLRRLASSRDEKDVGNGYIGRAADPRNPCEGSPWMSPQTRIRIEESTK
jgi:hypothetical protein